MLKDYRSPIESLPEFIADQTVFFSDSPAYFNIFPQALKDSSQLALLQNRLKFREFCVSRSFITPDFIGSDQFSKLSAWAVKRNKFPLAIKTATNLSDGEASFSLKAFRELPEFFDIIAEKYPGTILLEELIVPKARIEVTYVNSNIRLIAQVSLEKSMLMRHNWRAFPIKLPENALTEISNITREFSGLLEISDVPIRFSFALANATPTLLSVNSGWNRPEYHPVWRKAAGLADLASSKLGITSERVCKLLFFQGFKTTDFAPDALCKACNSTLARWAVVGDQVIVLLSAEKASTLLEESKRVDAMFKHLRD